MSSHPELRVGVDFGTTFTGVSFDTPKEKVEATTIINEWPGESGSENKVPTVLAKYDSGTDIRWGFLCRDMADDETWKLLKLLLDPVTYREYLHRDPPGPWVPQTMDEVRSLVVKYLSQIYIHISNKIPELIKKDYSFSQGLRAKTWDAMEVEFVFSTPATWGPHISQCFKGLVSRSGFGKPKNHSVILGLTEAEAAAVFTCLGPTGHKILNNNILLSIDAGGGTTDLAFVRKTSSSVTLTEMTPVSGIGVGSAKIDRHFTKLIQARMERYPVVRGHLSENFALKASQSDGFQTWKHNFGSEDWDQEGMYFTNVAEANEYTHDNFGIKQGNLYFTRLELQGCFDATLEEIKKHIQAALQDWIDEKPDANEVVDYIVLSGGLGGSAYVLTELTEYINSVAEQGNSRLVGSKVLIANGDTRTVVISGLLDDRKSEANGLREYVARANYGIIVRNSKPRGLFVGETNTLESIDWLVKYKDNIRDGQPIIIKITRYLGKHDQRKWTEKIVWLSKEQRRPPPETTTGEERGMKVLHNVNLEVNNSTRLKTYRRWLLSTKYHKCTFELALVIGPSGDCVVTVSENSLTLTERQS